MGEYSKKLHYRRNGVVADIKLYDTPDDVGENYITIWDNESDVYAAMVSLDDAYASDLRVRKDGKTYAVATEYTSIDPNPRLLLERTRAGTHTTYYKVGNYFNIKLNGYLSDGLTLNDETYRAVIIGFDHNKELETGGSNSTHLAICKNTDDVSIAFCDSGYGKNKTSGVWFNHYNDLSGITSGWSGSNIRQKILSNVFNALPLEWQAVISPVTKYTNNKGNTSAAATEDAVTATVDKMFIPSVYEVWGVRVQENKYEQNYQKQYPFFKQLGVLGGYNSNQGIYKTPFKNHATLTETEVWTRSVYQKATVRYFCAINKDGNCGWTSCYTCKSIIPCFAVM